jgi:hypothetical protein
MEKKLKRQRIINLILVIALIVGFVQFKDFKTETENRFNNLSHQYNNLNNNINSIYNNVDEKLEEQASLITYFNYEYGELDSENLKVPVRVKIIPKTATASTKLTLDFGARTVEMKKGENMEYTADFESDLFLGESGGMVNLIIRDGNTTQSEELEWYKSSLHSNYLPEIMAGFTFDKTSFSEEKGLTVDGDVMFMSDIYESNGTAFSDLKLVYTINGNIVEKQEIPETVFETAVDDIDIYKTYPDAKAEDTFTLYIEGADEYGLLHRVTLKEFVCSVTESDSEDSDNGFYETILDKNGNVLYEGVK